jgi:hypothetical protein
MAGGKQQEKVSDDRVQYSNNNMDHVCVLCCAVRPSQTFLGGTHTCVYDQVNTTSIYSAARAQTMLMRNWHDSQHSRACLQRKSPKTGMMMCPISIHPSIHPSIQPVLSLSLTGQSQPTYTHFD